MYNFHLYNQKDIKKLLGKDFAFYDKGFIAGKQEWVRLSVIQDKLIAAINSGKLQKEVVKSEYAKSAGGYISDEMIGGMLCPADGKTYDSKSSYYKAVKAAGCEIVGNDPITPSKPQGEAIDWQRAVYESLQQHK